MAAPRVVTGRSRGGAPYTVLGDNERVLVVSPGFTPNNRDAEGLVLQGIVQAFEEYLDDFRVVLVNRSSDAAQSENIHRLSDEFLELIDELHLEPKVVGLVGSAIGGMIALDAAARSGADFMGLVMVGSAIRLSESGRRILGRACEHADNERWRRLAFTMVSSLFPDSLSRGFFGSVAWMVPALFGVPEDPDDFIGLLRAALSADLSEQADRVSLPARLFAGDRDFFYGADEVAATESFLGNASTTWFPGRGHGVAREKASRIDQEIRRFFASEASNGSQSETD